MEVSSAELRGEVLAACDPNEGARVIAVRFQVSESRVRRIGQVRREAGQMAPQTASVRQPKWHARSDWLAAKKPPSSFGTSASRATRRPSRR